MTKKIIACLLVACSLLSYAYAEESIVDSAVSTETEAQNPLVHPTFGNPNDWTVSDEYIEDVFKYDIGASTAGILEVSYGEYENEVKDLLALEIMGSDENGAFDIDANVTVKEFTEVYDKLFYRGVFEGLYDKINKNSSVKAFDVIEAFVDGLGYTREAEIKGYYAVAQWIGLTKGTSFFSVNENITKGQFAKIIHNSLTIPMNVIVEYGNTIVYQVDESKTILNEVLEVVEVEGFVNGIWGLNLYSKTNVKKDEILIDKVRYSCGGNDLSRFVGQRVRGYAKVNSDTAIREIVYIKEDPFYPFLQYNIKDDMEEITSDTVKFKNSEGKINEFNLNAVTILNYNGNVVPVSRITTLINSVSSGSITFSQTGKTGTYDVAIIKSFSTYVVRSVDVDKKEIYPCYGLSFNGNDVISFANNAALNIYNDKGERIKLEDIKNGNVVSVYSNSDGSFGEMIVSNKQVSGTITSIENFAGIMIYGVGDELLKTSKEFDLAISNPLNKLPILDINVSAAFNVSFDGRIAGISTIMDGTYLGYMKACGINGNRLDAKYAVKLFTEEGVWKTYNLKDKITLDGVDNVDSSTLPKYIERNVEFCIENINAQAGNKAHSLVRYKLNGDDEIIFLDTLYDTTQEAEDAGRMKYQATVIDEDTWSGGFSWELTNLHFTNDTKLFSIPNDISKEDKFRVLSSSDFGSGLGGDVEVSFYSIDEFLCAKYGVVEEPVFSVGSVKWQVNSLLVVDNIVTAYDENNEEDPIRYKIKGRTWGNKVQEVEWYLDENFLDYNTMPKVNGVYRYLATGDIVKYLNPMVENGIMPIEFQTVALNQRHHACGTIKHVNDTMITISVADAIHSWKISGTIMLQERATGKTKQVDKAVLREGDKVYMYGNVHSAAAIFVLR